MCNDWRDKFRTWLELELELELREFIIIMKVSKFIKIQTEV